MVQAIARMRLWLFCSTRAFTFLRDANTLTVVCPLIAPTLLDSDTRDYLGLLIFLSYLYLPK